MANKIDTKDIQEVVQIFSDALGLNAPLESRVLDMVSEVGELSKELLKGTEYGDKEFLKTADWEGELGDVFFSLLCIANATGVNLGTSLESVLKKYEARFKNKGSIGSGR